MLIAITPALTIRQTAVSFMDNNVYLLTCKATGQQALIDAADDPAAITRLLESAAEDSVQSTKLTDIITTHQHFDHIRALAQVAKMSGAKLIAGRADLAAIEQATGVEGINPVDHGDRIQFGRIELAVFGIRGHTPGGIALAYCAEAPSYLFTGDSLFPGGVGATGNDPARFAALLNDLTNRLFAVFDDQTVVLPGHGQSTTIGNERPGLEDWSARGW